MESGERVRVWLPDPSQPGGGRFWPGEVTADSFSDGAIGVRIHGFGGAVAKVPPFLCFEGS